MLVVIVVVIVCIWSGGSGGGGGMGNGCTVLVSKTNYVRLIWLAQCLFYWLQQDKSVTSPAMMAGTATLPRVKSTPDIESEEEPEGTGRFRKNHQKHARRASESVVAMQRDAEGRSSKWFECPPIDLKFQGFCFMLFE